MSFTGVKTKIEFEVDRNVVLVVEVVVMVVVVVSL
jgi:hypothetical protein